MCLSHPPAVETTSLIKNRKVMVEVNRRRGAGESKEERRVWGLTLNPDPEAEKRPKDALKTTGRDVPPSRARISF